MSRFCSSPTSNMLRVKYSEDARERRNQRKNRASWCCFSVVSAAFLIQQAKKAPHNRELCGVYPSRRSGVVKPGLGKQTAARRGILAEEAAWSNPDGDIALRPDQRILAEEAAWSNPDKETRWGFFGDILAEEAAWSNPDRIAVNINNGVILAEEAAWSNPDPPPGLPSAWGILAEEAAWSNPDHGSVLVFW